MNQNEAPEESPRHSTRPSASRLSSIKRLTSIAACLFVAAAWAAPAVAVPVTQWSVMVQSGFSAFGPAGPDAVTASAPNAGIGGLPTVLSWGGASELSTVATVTSSSLFTNGAAIGGPSITYSANPLTSGSSGLETATHVFTLLLTPMSPVPGSPVGPVPFLHNIFAGPTAGGDGFVLDNSGAFGFDFILDDIVYAVGIETLGLGLLPEAACLAVNSSAGCSGIIVPHGEQGTVSFAIAISADILAVPEPGTLALFVAGLFGLTFVGRRTSYAARS